LNNATESQFNPRSRASLATGQVGQVKNMSKQKSIHKLKKASAYSFSVTIPKEIVEKYKWREKQKLVVVDKGNGKVEISDWRRK
jgi:hypothetical protein